MFYLSEEQAEAAEAVSGFDPFDLFMIAFTVILIWAVVRALKARPQNKFALAFSVVSLLVFLVLDAVMVMNWINPA